MRLGCVFQLSQLSTIHANQYPLGEGGFFQEFPEICVERPKKGVFQSKEGQFLKKGCIFFEKEGLFRKK